MDCCIPINTVDTELELQDPPEVRDSSFWDDSIEFDWEDYSNEE